MLSLLIDLFSVLIFAIPLYLILSKKYKNNFTKLYSILFIVYIIAMFSLVGIPSINYIRTDFGFNFIPLLDIVLSPKTSLLNILLFIPLGIFLPMLWKENYNNKFSKVLIFGFLLSLIIEILQIFTFRLTDINDLITNTLGTVIGYLIYIKLLKNNTMFKNIISEKMNPIILVGIIFIIMFTLSPFISGAIWNLIL